MEEGVRWISCRNKTRGWSKAVKRENRAVNKRMENVHG